MTEPTNIVVCPSCGAENIEGTDTCERCLADLRTVDVPEIYQIASESDLLLPVSSMRLRRAQAIAPETLIRDAITRMQESGAGAVVVATGERIIGIFTERDVLKRCAGDEAAFDRPVTDCMTRDPVVLNHDDNMAVALNKMGVGGFRHIPIIENGQFIGMITARDVWNWIMGRYFD